jgi:hypothetical protein
MASKEQQSTSRSLAASSDSAVGPLGCTFGHIFAWNKTMKQLDDSLGHGLQLLLQPNQVQLVLVGFFKVPQNKSLHSPKTYLPSPIEKVDTTQMMMATMTVRIRIHRIIEAIMDEKRGLVLRCENKR